MFGAGRFRFWGAGAAALVLLWTGPSVLAGRDQPTLEELKAQVANASIGDRPKLCLEVSERQLDAAEKLYGAGDTEKAKSALEDVVAFSELSRDYAIQSHKHEKQSEIAVRKMVHKLADLKHILPHEDQSQVQNAIDRLQRVRDDLLSAMFPKGGNR